MRVSLVVNPVTHDWKTNLDVALRMVQEAAGTGSHLVLLGEMAITGMVNNDDPSHDLPMGECIPGPITSRFQGAASDLGIWIGFGLLEREAARLFDTALLVSPKGEITLRHRRVQSRWHGKSADPGVYVEGGEIERAETDFGSVSMMICGDLWDEALRRRVRDLRPDLVLHPFARCFPGGLRDQAKWDNEELPDYQQRVREIGAPVLATSYLCVEPFMAEADAFGGAMQFGRDGGILARHPLDRPGILQCRLDKTLAQPSRGV